MIRSAGDTHTMDRRYRHIGLVKLLVHIKSDFCITHNTIERYILYMYIQHNRSTAGHGVDIAILQLMNQGSELNHK